MRDGGAFDGIYRITTQIPFPNGLLQGCMQGHMDQLDRARAFALVLHQGIQLLDVTGQDILESQLAQHGQDIKSSISPISIDGAGPSGKFLAVQPDFEEAFQRELGSFEGETAVNFAERLLDPIMAFLLSLAVLGQASSIQTDLGAPQAILPLVQAAFIITSSFRHAHFSFSVMEYPQGEMSRFDCAIRLLRCDIADIGHYRELGS